MERKAITVEDSSQIDPREFASGRKIRGWSMYRSSLSPGQISQATTRVWNRRLEGARGIERLIESWSEHPSTLPPRCDPLPEGAGHYLRFPLSELVSPDIKANLQSLQRRLER